MHYSLLYTQYLSKLQQKNLLRTINPCVRNTATIDFSNNDYLGLASNPYCIEQGYSIAKEFGMGATGSRLLSGSIPLMNHFEERIAHDKNTQKALLFPSGYQANSTVVAELFNTNVIGKNTLVLFDKANHASLYHGLFLSGAHYKRFFHNNVHHLKELLLQHASDYQNIILIIESIYGMDGDIAPLNEYITLCKQYNILLYIDEAHATGIFGQNGYGVSTLYDLTEIEHCIMGTFSKALGGMGAYVATHATFIEYLITACNGFIYSTALSPFLVGAMYSAWNILPSLQKERQQILTLATTLRKGLMTLGYNTTPDTTHIVPLIHSDQNHIQYLHNTLCKNNIITSFIRPPTVPPHAPRLRFALTVHHTLEHIEYVLHLLSKL